jgi:rRNA processing protein Krr1/Pno1
MAPKKKGGAKQETPEQLAARRAAAMAMFQTTSTPKEPAKGSAASKPAAAAKQPPAEAMAALDVSDAAPPPKAEVKAERSGFSSDEDDDKPVGATAASSGKGELVTSLPTEPGWVKILTFEPMAALVKKAKKEGKVEDAPNGCKLHIFKDVAYLFSSEGHHVLAYRTQIDDDAAEGLGELPLVRVVGDKKAQQRITGKDDVMWNAIASHSGATLAMLPTGHVSVVGDGAQSDSATSLIDNLIDGDGATARETLAAKLAEAEPWCGVLEFPVPDEWVGAIIGKGGSGIKQIASESGALIDYVDPEEEASKAAEAGKAVEVSDGDTADGAAAKLVGHFRIRGKFENQCRLAAKRIEERLALVQKLDVHGYVMVPRGVVGRLIGKGGSNIKQLQRASGASRIAFDKEPGGRSTTQAATLQATDIETAVGAAKVILEAVPDPSASLEHKNEMARRLEDWGNMVNALTGVGRDAPPVADATREMAEKAHRAKFGTAVLNSDQQTKDRPAELAAVDFDVWVWQWAVCQPLRAA